MRPRLAPRRAAARAPRRAPVPGGARVGGAARARESASRISASRQEGGCPARRGRRRRWRVRGPCRLPGFGRGTADPMLATPAAGSAPPSRRRGARVFLGCAMIPMDLVAGRDDRLRRRDGGLHARGSASSACSRAGLLERAIRRSPATSPRRRDERLSAVGTAAGNGAPVCTPSRRSWIDGARVRARTPTCRVELPEEALPPMPATVVALARRRHVAAGAAAAASVARPAEPAGPQLAGGAKSPGHQPTASG